MSAVPRERPLPTTVPSRRATKAIVFVLPPSTPSSSGSTDCELLTDESIGKPAPMGRRHLLVDRFRRRQRHDQRVAGQGRNRVAARAGPGGFGSERLVLAEGFDQPANLARQRWLGDRRRA